MGLKYLRKIITMILMSLRARNTKQRKTYVHSATCYVLLYINFFFFNIIYIILDIYVLYTLPNSRVKNKDALQLWSNNNNNNTSAAK